MEYISSDTNVWLDFAEINKLHLPFRLPYIYLMDAEMINDELLSPPGLGEKLSKLGLQKTELTEEEFFWLKNLDQNIRSHLFSIASRWQSQRLVD